MQNPSEYPDHFSVLSSALLSFFFPTTFFELTVIKVFALCSVDRDKKLMTNNVTTKQYKNFLGKKLRFKFLHATKKRRFFLYLRRLPSNFRSVLDCSIDSSSEHYDVKALVSRLDFFSFFREHYRAAGIKFAFCTSN